MISSAIEAALSSWIASHEALQALLLLQREADRVWRAEDVAAALHIEGTLASRTLRALADGGLLALDAGASPPAYRYSPAGPELAALVDELREAWFNQPLEIIRIMNSKAISRTRTEAIRAFADAFILPGSRRDD
jgi:hypothetical protein